MEQIVTAIILACQIHTGSHNELYIQRVQVECQSRLSACVRATMRQNNMGYEALMNCLIVKRGKTE